MAKQQPRKYSIPEAAKELHLSEAYIRLMVREGIIETERIPLYEGARVVKHWISQPELDAFANRDTRRSPRREDGRGKYCFYASPDEAARVKELLYLTHDEGLAIVAHTIDLKTKAEEYHKGD